MKEPSVSGSDTCRTHCGQNCERNWWVHSQCAQWPPGWAHWESDQNVPTDHIEIKVVGTLKKYSQWVAQTRAGHIVSNIVKEPPGFFYKVPAGHILNNIVKETGGFFQKIPTGCLGEYFMKELSMYLLDTCWTNCLKNLNVTLMYLPDKWPLAPSVIRRRWDRLRSRNGGSGP